MSMHVDTIIDDLCAGSLSLEAACESLMKAAQGDPNASRFWGQRVETAMSRERISRAAARTLLDALEGFPTDKTVWIDSGLATAPARKVAAAPQSERFQAAERLIASLVERTTSKPQAITTPTGQAPMTGPVEWFDERALAESTDGTNPLTVGLGTVLRDRYRIVGNLGAGGIGQVYQAVDLANGAEAVTIKVVAVNLRHQPGAFASLQAAVRHTQHLRHENIVGIRNIDRHGDSVFIVMEPLQGRWLSGLIREVRGDGVPYDTAWPIISGIANGLAYAHAHGIVHADLSPHAVFLCEDGTPKIMCFELVHAVPTSNESLDVLDTLTLRAYTEAYAADPWAQHSKPQPADDLYPLGVIAYEMLTGRHPFQRSSMAVARQKSMKFVPITGLNKRATKLLERCLSFERRDRPATADRFLKRMQPSFVERMLSAT
ncbi:MAG: serine/threonine-protein kinase [Povalibacter sp.]